MTEPIAITGFGAVGPWGAGLDRLAELFPSGSVPITPLSYAPVDSGGRAAPCASLVPTDAWKGAIPMLKARRLSPPARFAVVAAAEARNQAGLDAVRQDPQTGVALATAFGPASFTERLLDQLDTEGADGVSPAIFSECVANAAAAQVALFGKLGGPSITICGREAGPLIAFDRARRYLQSGRARRMLVGTSDEITPLACMILNRFRSITRTFAEGVAPATPFARTRDGFLPAEGAVIAVLESEKSAAERGASPLAWLRGTVRGFDPQAPRSGYPVNAGRLATILRKGLSRQSIELDSIDAIVSGASGSRVGDATEAEILHLVWPDGVPALHAPKARVGEFGGGQLAAAWLLLTRGIRAADYGPADFEDFPGLAWATPAAHRPRRLLISSMAAGGAVSWLVMDTVRAT
jgi:3-oxoacyl-(acyl-carrier-protein) synthase